MSRPQNMNTIQGQNWCFTLNNPDEQAEPMLATFAAHENCKYLVYGREVGAGGTPHLQGYLELQRKWRGSTLKQNIGERAHIELRKAKAYQAAEYCKKDGDFTEFGDAPTPPKTNETKQRWRQVLDKCQAGDWDYMAKEEPYLWLMQEKKLRSHYKCPKNIPTLDNEWIYGPTGTGKSRDARTRYPDAYIKDASSHWWDGYNGEEVVIIEDLDKYHVKQGYYLKIWADHYAFPAQIKGGQMMVRPLKIIVTSNYHPRDIWQDDTTVGPLERRFKLTLMGPIEPPMAYAPLFNIPPPTPPIAFELPLPEGFGQEDFDALGAFHYEL